MSTETWIRIWTWSLYGALAAFALLTVFVIIFGLRDIRLMFASLRDDGRGSPAGNWRPRMAETSISRIWPWIEILGRRSR